MSAVLDILSWFFLCGGAVFCVIGGIGIVRLPDFYTRTHGASITDTMGAGMVLIGLMFQAGMATVPWLVVSKLAFILLLLLLTSPTSGHALVKAASARGVRWEEEPKGGGDALPD